ncbi:DoxX family membrane protein [Fulvivirga kasyanovii]|uniref:DoxX family protein n=1 Tax=Fulvivirga kasyanovii TaxID=396812 RepID=A0ABW9RRQ2_9BACT|nr:DoxX family protein [Fulvivirga kasyanovii]MTI25969.1 DoxX family protein [Fulvivirga kasyanovii]
MDYFKILIIAIRLALGGLFIYGGLAKFQAKPPEPKKQEIVQQSDADKTSVSTKKEIAPEVNKIRSFIGGLKQSGYFWAFLGICEIACGLLLLSQYFSLLGAVMLVPLTLNIFLFHIFLTPDDVGENLMTALYLIANLTLIFYDYPRLKAAFFNHSPIKLTTQS